MRFFRRALTVVFLVAVTASGLSALSVYRYSFRRSLEQADAAVVLGAAVWRDEPSPVYRERIEHAIDLYMAGVVDYIIFTGGIGHNDALSEAEVGREYAIAIGSDPEHMLTEDESEYTHENLKNARELAQEVGIANFLIVSDPLHMKRALAIAEDLGMEAAPSPTPSSRFRSWRTKLPFLVRETYYYLGYQLRNLVQPFAAALGSDLAGSLAAAPVGPPTGAWLGARAGLAAWDPDAQGRPDGRLTAWSESYPWIGS